MANQVLRWSVASWLAASALALPALAEDPPINDAANFETPQVHPIEIGEVHRVGEPDETRFIAVCNTPDNSIAIFNSAGTPQERVRVGIGPATVRWNDANDRLYVCNLDGDSVSMIQVEATGADTVSAKLLRTVSLHSGNPSFVGDEPGDIAFTPDNATAVVTWSGRSQVGLYDADTMQAVPSALSNGLFLDFGDQQVLHTPRYMEILDNESALGQLLIANMRAGTGSRAAPLRYHAGLYRQDLTLSPSVAVIPDPLDPPVVGSTNHAFAVTSNGSQIFLVGTRARVDVTTEAAVSQLKTGFVQSWLTVIDNLNPMNVAAEAPEGSATTPFPSINLNRDYSGAGTPVDLEEVPGSRAIVQPTGVALIESARGEVECIVVTGFHSDSVGFLWPDGTKPGGYEVRLLPLTPEPGYSICGPRGVVYSPDEDRVYVNGRLDNTLIVIDPGSPTTDPALVTKVPLGYDPTPDVIRVGREFFYSNEFSSGFVSCASCHVDGRTDGLPWDLSSGTPDPSDPIVQGLVDMDDPRDLFVVGEPFPINKGPIVTQTMQGLVNYELNLPYQYAATNAPYYWRGARAGLSDFNKAFVNLQDADEELGPVQMRRFEAFINTIRHPPNSEQNVFRRIDAGFSELFTGMEAFHERGLAAFAGRACVDCHHLPEGSSNTLTLPFNVGPLSHPFESATLRNIRQRELLVHTDLTPVPLMDPPLFQRRKSEDGLLHSGDPSFSGFFFEASWSMNNFTQLNPSFAPQLGAEAVDVNSFIRQFDTGTAPVVGFALTVDPTAISVPVIDILEKQAEDANLGLAVYVRTATLEQGYWYDVTVEPEPLYREEGGTTTVTLAQILLSVLNGGSDAIGVFQTTPLGHERRWASDTGIASPFDETPAPTNLVLEPMAPTRLYEEVTQFDQNLHYDLGTSTVTALAHESMWTLRTLQHSIVQAFLGTPSLDLGVDSVHHEPPRRFRVSGDNILPGAKMTLIMAGDIDNEGNPIDPRNTLEMDLYPLNLDPAAADDLMWETRVELDATQTFALLNGGYFANDVEATLDRTTATPMLKPDEWNWFQVKVENQDRKFGTSDWQRLTVQDVR